jgi:hypothetical protein
MPEGGGLFGVEEAVSLEYALLVGYPGLSGGGELSDICWRCKHYAAWHKDKVGRCDYHADGKFCTCLGFEQDAP